MISFSNILIVFIIAVLVVLASVLVFYFSYRHYLNLRIQNKCKKKYFLHPFTFMLYMIIALLIVVIGVSHFNLKELKTENSEIKASYDESKKNVFCSLKEEDHTYDIYINGLVNNSLPEYEIKKDVQNDFEFYFAKTDKDIKYMPKYLIYVRYIGMKESLNGYFKYKVNDENSFQGTGNVEKEYIVLSSSLESLPTSIEIGISDSTDKTNENYYMIVTFNIKY